MQKIVALAFAALISAAPYAVAADGENNPLAVYREAGASKEQQAQINVLAKEFEGSSKVKAERAVNLLKRMQDFTLEPNPDEKMVMATQEEINALQAELANARVRTMLKIRQVLSQEQRLRLVEILKQKRQGIPAQAR